MTSSKSTKRALISSALAILMCVTMLIGTTFAWFTDTASTAVNKIQSGNLDIAVEYRTSSEGDWKTLDNATDLFGAEGTLFEPGHTRVVELKIKNAGNLALKYKIGMNVVSETAGINKDGNSYKLSNYLKVATTAILACNTGNPTTDATAAWFDTAVFKKNFSLWKNNQNFGNFELEKTDDGIVNQLLPGGEVILGMKVYMPETVGNEANAISSDKAASINFGLNVVATQHTVESDSFGNTYDENADYTIQVNKDNIQDYLDGKYGSIDGMTLVLAAGDYGTLELGRATKYPGSHTETYLLKSGDVLDAKTIDEIKGTIAANPGGGYGTPCYIRSMSNVTFKAAVGAQVSVAGVYAFSGHRYQDGYDYVLDRDVVNGSNTYYVANRLTNITFDGITFTAKSNIETSQEQAIINGFTFKNCTFNIGHTENNSDYIALRYYNENNNGNVRNLVVDKCEFNNCRQGVYTSHVYGVSVTNSTFNTTGHNAIAVQAHGNNLCNHGKVVITGNVFNNIGDRIIRFNNVGADTQITIKYNTATNSGDTAGEVIKATSLADGIKYDISGNNWGNGKTVANTEFADK